MSTAGETLPPFDGTQPCLQVDPELFFPATAEAEKARAVELRALCDSCPFAQDCLEYALTNRLEGIWAGTTSSQRRAMRRDAGAQINAQQRRLQRNRATVAKLLDQGLNSTQIIARTGLPERSVYRVIQRLRQAQSDTVLERSSSAA